MRGPGARCRTKIPRGASQPAPYSTWPSPAGPARCTTTPGNPERTGVLPVFRIAATRYSEPRLLIPAYPGAAPHPRQVPLVPRSGVQGQVEAEGRNQCQSVPCHKNVALRLTI